MLKIMLDIRHLRENPEEIKKRLAARGTDFSSVVDRVLTIDADRRAVETRLQALQAERNRLSKEIGKLRVAGQDSSGLEADVKSAASEMTALGEESEKLAGEQRDILLSTPNLPDPSVPAGRDASDNPVIREWGAKPEIAQPKDHVEIAESLGLIDPDRATKISGSGFMVYTGAGARLERALINFLLDLHTTKHGYTEVAPPFLVRRDCMVGTSQLPKFEEDMYGVDEGGLFLTPTAEVPVTNLHREEILPADRLPLRYAAYTPCFRREAGSAGRETRGLIRMHQFDKIELVKICRPEDSEAELELLTADAERVLQELGLHYRTILLCTGDMGFGSAKTYDIEVWAPGQGSYLEVSSCSNFREYQARRMNLRFKDADGKNRFCHTLNGSGTALARLYVALLESGLRPDGSVHLPSVLEPYFGSTVIRPLQQPG
ncbi:MAG: serine--tRNA ligase [Terrimicrobiaceae bacterium]